MKASQPDYSGPVEIAQNIYWVGNRTEKDFESNAYLRVFKGNGKQFNLLIDPGPSPDFNVIAEKIEQVLGANYHLDLVYLNHQDPDVCINTVYFQRHFPKLQIVTSEDTWRLVRFYGLKEKQFIATENFKSGRIKVKTGHQLLLIPTPYAHFRGACALYDEEQKVLFTGDLFGGLTSTPELYAEKDYWAGMKTFHEIYMPTNLALKKAVNDFRKQAGDINILASQHGKIIRKEFIEFFMSKLEKLPVGLDLKSESRLVVENHINAFNDILDRVEKEVDGLIVETVLNAFSSDGSFPNTFIIKKGKIYSLTLGVEESCRIFSTELCDNLSKEQKGTVQKIITDCFGEWNISTPLPCQDDIPSEVASAAATTQDFFEDGDSTPKKQSSTNPLDFEKKELDSFLDNLLD
jgi:glyoxylase-like metal-dependent hydrolase (beta-lactamase superfamily II)